jgi:hypothetical protein
VESQRELSPFAHEVLDGFKIQLLGGVILETGIIPAQVLEILAALGTILGISQNDPKSRFVLAAGPL